ncbi:MAG: PD40 domain-containing protein [Planctomycetes bacterium]|nr:PD40 domain-containing protein [Planctomycetota bacterium]
MRTGILRAAGCLVALLIIAQDATAEDLVRFDFETGDLQGWKIVEGQFDYFISDRPTYHNFRDRKYNKQGKYYFSTVEQQPGKPSSDKMTGVAESPVFTLAAAEMTMLVGGGDFRESYVALCTLDGKQWFQARGRTIEEMVRVTWNAPELVGKKVFLKIVDGNTQGWGHVTFDDFTARGKIDAEATKEHFAATVHRTQLAQFRAAVAQTNLEPLQAAVEDLARKFPDRYPGGEFLRRLEEYRTRIARIEEAINRGDNGPLEDAPRLAQELTVFSRQALVANPLIVGRPIVFVVRNQYRSHYHAIDTLFHTGEFNPDRNQMHSDLFQGGGALKVIDLANGGEARTLVDVPEGIARDPDVYFDGTKIVFALRRNVAEDYHIWEINTDGTGLRQLTRAPGVSDFDPIYMPDDSIVFSSTREPKYNMCSRDIAANLFRMEADGANIHQITKNTLFENHAELMPDGRILYARWEYVDRNFGDAHGLWTVNPDGTNQAIYWGNNTAVPGAVFNAHVIPGTQRIVCIFGPHHDRLWGALGIIDRRLGIDGRLPVVRTWPAHMADTVRIGGGFDCDSFGHLPIRYEDPWPLDDTHFLCSRMIGKGEQTGIYLIDLFGNEVLLHTEGPGCYDPMPLGPRVRPPVVPSRRDFTSPEGFFFVADVYQGTHMQGIERGEVKYLRVVESPEKRHWSRGSWNAQGYTAPGMNWHSLENKRILGTVPVEADGSAHFAVPAEKFVFFQLLDEDGMMIQSMRSGTVAQPGETTGCVGCHDERRTAPPPLEAKMPMALKRPPSELDGWYGPPRSFGFTAEVQPVLDRHCVECHDYGKEAGKKLNLAGDRTVAFNTAYHELWRKGHVRCVGGGPAAVQGPRSWGSHASRLMEVIRKPKIAEHQKIKLTKEDFDRVATWLDLNGVYYPTYECAYPESLTGRSPLDNGQLNRLAQLTGISVGTLRNHAGNQGPQVSFDRPELSPCLTKLAGPGDPKYKEALAIIRAGGEMLARRPRADMPGFVPCETDRQREEKYATRRQAELDSRQAIRTGGKVYDP